MNGKQLSVVSTRQCWHFHAGEYLEYISVYFSEMDVDVLFKRKRREIDYAISITKAVM